jgi:hypothetical protein
MGRFQVIVGNVGTVYDGDDEAQAIVEHSQYCVSSRVSSGRCAGESVVLMKDGDIEKEHQGYQWMFENHSTAELTRLLSERRKSDPGRCPICSGNTTRHNKSYIDQVGVTKVTQHCLECGFNFMDVMTIERVELSQ